LGKVSKHVTLFEPKRSLGLDSDFLDMWQGYYQKVKPARSILTVNVDVTFGLV